MTPDKLITVRISPVHGRGVVTVRPIRKGTHIMQYRGKHMTWDEALEVHPHNEDEPNHTFIFDLGDGTVIDGYYGRCAAKYINHSCDPNCDSDIIDGEVWIKAIRDIPVGVELTFDYRLEMEGTYPTEKIRKDFECRCGSANCRGTMLNVDAMLESCRLERLAAKKAAKKRA